MKFIAPKDFNQGPDNPLRIPDGTNHVEIGTVFSIGDDDTPTEELAGEDLKTYKTFLNAGCLCPLDSNRGQHILAEVARLKMVEKEMHDEELGNSGDKWWQKPAGITALAVIGVVIVVIVIMIFFHA
jgi:hypothetical protein